MDLLKKTIECILLTSLCSVAGCRSSSTASPDPANTSLSKGPSAVAPAHPVDPATAGTLTGTVLIKGNVPAPIKIDMSMDPACALAPGDNTSEQYVAKDGHLANVYVYIKAGLPASSAPAGAAPVKIDQKGCRFLPHVAAIQQGGTVAYTNSDPTMHNVHTMAVVAGDANVDVSEAPGAAPAVRRYDAPETMIPIRCNNHPWMQAFLNVAPNPYFAVTGPEGTFTLPNLPPGTYTLAAVHEKLGEQDTQIVISPHAAVKTTLTFTMP